MVKNIDRNFTNSDGWRIYGGEYLLAFPAHHPKGIEAFTFNTHPVQLNQMSGNSLKFF